MAEQDDWLSLLNDIRETLLMILTRLSAMGKHGRSDARFFAIFVLQAAQDIEGIRLLYLSGLKEPAQVLVRAILECRINFDMFVLKFLRDPAGTMTAVMDAMMLEKIKQMEATNFRGLELVPGAPTPAELRKRESEIEKRWTPSQVKAFRKYGFSGISVEQRARKTGHIDLYNIVYRNFSRNVHGSDYGEYLMKDLESKTIPKATYVAMRDHVSLSTTAFCGTGIIQVTAAVFRIPLKRKVASLKKRAARFERAP